MKREALLKRIAEREEQRHSQALSDLRSILETDFGFRFFVYLYREMEVGSLPPINFEGQILYDKMGALRAANSINDLVNAVSPDTAGRIFAQREKELHATRLLDETATDETD